MGETTNDNGAAVKPDQTTSSSAHADKEHSETSNQAMTDGGHDAPANALNASALSMFAAPSDPDTEDGDNIDLDDLFQDCYFGDFPVPPFTQPALPPGTANAPSTFIPLPDPMSQTQTAHHPGAHVPQKRKIENGSSSVPTPIPISSAPSSAHSTMQLPSSTMISATPTPASRTTAYSDASASQSAGSITKKLTDQQKLERRERNREHAKRSRLRKKFLLESLQDQIHGLQSEIESLKGVIRKELPDRAESLLTEIEGNKEKYTPLPMPSGFGPVKTLMEPDFRLMSALSNSQQNFAISDPSLPDNPIVYVSQGFLELTGYTLDQVLGRNCRFLQGPGTDQSAVDVIRRGIREGVDTSVCLLNYKADGTPFWNQFFVAALRDAENNVVNFVGVQCEVSKAVVESHMKDGGSSS